MSATDTGLTAEDLDLLTPEERAAIEDGAADAAEQAALARLAAAAPDDEDDDDDGEDDGAADSTAPVAAPAPTPAPTAAPEPAPVTADAKKATAYEAALPADFEAKQTAVKDKLADLRKSFKDGALEVDEYEEQREVLERERDALNTQRTKAEISQEMRQQEATNAWQAAINRTFDEAATPAGGGIDYRKDPSKAADLDLFVRRLGDDPANADKSMDWFLAEGHRRVKALHGVATTAPTAAPTPPAAPRRSPIDAAPKTLAQVPGADGPGDVSGEFADMDALDGDALESAIARLSPVQLDKYMRGR